MFTEESLSRVRVTIVFQFSFINHFQVDGKIVQPSPFFTSSFLSLSTKIDDFNRHLGKKRQQIITARIIRQRIVAKLPWHLCFATVADDKSNVTDKREKKKEKRNRSRCNGIEHSWFTLTNVISIAR